MQKSTFSTKYLNLQVRGSIPFLLGVLVFSFGTETFAQGGVLEEVIVTAQKREESIQDVPIAITAFSGQMLIDFGFTNNTEIARFTPGVYISGNNAGHTQAFTIRGATQNDFFGLAEAPNAMYIDEAYQASTQSQLFAVFDMERVEVLKGPQGTLFGRNATGGLVHYITKKPTQETEAYVDAAYGNYNQIRVEGAYSGALSDTVSIRIAGFHREHDAILENIFSDADLPPTPVFLAVPFTPNGGPPRGPLNGSLEGHDDMWTDDQSSIRGQILFEPNDDVEILLKGQWADVQLASGPYQNVATIVEKDAQNRVVNAKFSNATTNPNSCEVLVAGTTNCFLGIPGVAPPGSPLDLDLDPFRPSPNSDLFGYVDADGLDGLTTSTDHALANYDRTEFYAFTGKLSWDLDFGTLVAVSAYTNQDKRTSLDVDAGPAPQFIVSNNSIIDWFSQEVRLEGEADRFRWIAGVYYLNIDGEYSQSLGDTRGGLNVFGASPPPNGAGVSNLFLDGVLDSFLETKSYSVFGQIDYDLTDQLELNIGWRGIQEDKDYEYHSNLSINQRDSRPDGIREGGIIVASLLPDHTESPSDFLWSGKLGLNYSYSDDLMLYASINRGVKAGSCNAPLLTFLRPDQYCYDPEVLLAYEAGFKSTIMDGRARLNFAAYYYDYSDYQVFQFVGTSGAVFNVDAEYKGLEVDIVTSPVENMDILLGLGLIDPTVKDLNVAPDVPRDVEPAFTPKTQFHAMARYTWPDSIAGGSVALQVDTNYASSAFHNINNFDSDKMDSYWLANARLVWSDADAHWTVTGFVDNFTDERNQNIGFALANICGCDEQSVGLPRMYGVRVRYDF